MSFRAAHCLAIAAMPAMTMLLGCPAPTAYVEPTEWPFEFNVAAGEPIAIAGEAVYTDSPLFESVPGKSGSHAATLTAFGDGEMLAAWYSYDGPHELDGAVIYTSRRSAGAAVWTDPLPTIDHPESDGNPVLYSEGDRVWLFQSNIPFGWSTAHIVLQTSEDRGATWSAASAIDGPLGANVRYPPIRRHDGVLLLPAYDDLAHVSHFFTSNDGVNWTRASTLTPPFPAQILQPSVVELSGGRLVAVMRNTAGFLWVSNSDDGGVQWSAPRDSGFLNPGSAAQILRLQSGRLLLVLNDSATDRSELTVALSADEGRSWPLRRVFARSNSRVDYPTAAQTPDGLIQIVYTHDRQRIRHATLNESWVTGAGPDAPLLND